ncbi:hypothetical protein [Teredinibacter purpureus]|uniref:hypothetical protein n=1 Tax=Teredinibacter purpureus TaxID=2731756 RepID=UPI0005F8857C|nr:hypothetical protein [Teredinibacter purpureus]
MGITFKEKSLWIQIVTLSLVFGGYFLNLDYTITESLPSNLIPRFIWLIVALVILNILGHVLAAAFNKPENEDERDKLIELKATKIKAFILAAGIVIAILGSLKLQNLFITLNLLILFLVISEVVDKAVQVFYYRKGI